MATGPAPFSPLSPHSAVSLNPREGGFHYFFFIFIKGYFYFFLNRVSPETVQPQSRLSLFLWQQQLAHMCGCYGNKAGSPPLPFLPSHFPFFLHHLTTPHLPPSHHLRCKKGQWEALDTMATANWVLAPGWAIAMWANPCHQTFLWAQRVHPLTQRGVAFLIQGMGHQQP